MCMYAMGLQHITLLPFADLGGAVAPPYVIVSGKKVMRSWSVVWPEATIRATPKGSVTSELFVQAMIRWAEWTRAEHKLPMYQPLILVADSGGGALLHLSTDFTLACVSRNVRPFYLGPHSTKGHMGLDQEPNAVAERTWQDIRRVSPHMSSLEALDVAHEVWDAA